jgi:hypothetical protein
MSCYGNLKPDEKVQIESKLSELSHRTGKQWGYNVMDKRGQEEIAPILEVIVDGRSFRPVALPLTKQCSATVICEWLENYAEAMPTR